MGSERHSKGTGKSRSNFQSNFPLRDATAADGNPHFAELKQISPNKTPGTLR